METSSQMETPAVFRSGRGKNLQLVSERTTPSSSEVARAAAKEAELAAAMATVSTAFAILGSRALVILSALGAFALFGWASYDPTGWRFAAACSFTVLVFGPALWIDRRGA